MLDMVGLPRYIERMAPQNNVCAAKLSDEQWAAIDRTIAKYRKRTGLDLTYADIVRLGGETACAREGDTFPSRKDPTRGKYQRGTPLVSPA